ncbi:Asp23/Gls24 family envelope stress response protein [Actinomadura flavalba]|uniref:Asp23/Gls24 family envelope stress response protein n=1 Tax=Actinomadura flavalba TaxID=1120938 RepID=UPI000366D6AB|nr:Asp23/Gls24 family envelope stress response protein [Actinomadura flavalba]
MSQENGQANKGSGVGTLPNQASRPGSERSKDESGKSGSGLQKASDSESVLVTDQGKTRIADGVVAKVAGMATREIGGVHKMGSGMSRTFGSMKERLPGQGKNVSQGVSVQVGERQAAIDIDVVTEYGAAIPDLASAIRDNVIAQVEHMTGLEVVEVNISVDDIHLPDEDNGDDDGTGKDRQQEPESKPRVQ